MSEERKVIQIKIDDILPNRFQPRIRFDEEAITELSASIKEHGVIQPIVVRPVGDKYEIIAGERRYKASVMANLESIPAVITNLDDKDSAEVALIENVQRQDLTPIEEAISYRKILDMGYLTQDKLATKLGKSQSAVANKLRLLNLEDDVQEALLNENISERHARSLLKIEDSAKQIEMLNRIINERLTVRKTDEEIDKMMDNNKENDNSSIFELDNLNLLNNDSQSNVDSDKPIDFSFNNEPEKENLFDISEPVEETSNFFGFNQNINNELNNETLDNKENYFDAFKNDDEKTTESSIVDDYKINDELFASTNPGFMDLNKIEAEAKDIYQEKQQSDINNLLEPTLLINDEENVETSTIFDTNSEVISNVENETINNENEMVNSEKETFNSNLFDQDMTDEEKYKPGRFFNMFNNEIQKEEENNDYNSLFDSVPETNNDQPTNEDFDKLFNQDLVDDKENVSFPETNKNDINELETYEFNEFVPQEIETKMEENPVDMVNNSYDIEEQNQNNNEEANEEINTIDSNISENTIVEKTNIIPAINKIRECITILEKEGLTIDIEELDFENQYQINIKINK